MRDRRISKQHEQLKKVFIFGIFALAICGVICFFHVRDMRRNFEAEINKNLHEHFNVTAQIVEEQTEKFKLELKPVVSDISSVIKRSSLKGESQDKAINKVLNNYKNLNGFSRIVYVDLDGMIYYHDYKKQEADNKHFFNIANETIRIADDSIQLIENQKGSLFYMLPIITHEERAGTVVAVKSIEGTLNNYAFKHLNEIGSTFVVKQDGTIISSKITLNQKEAEENIFKWIENQVKDTVKNENKLLSIKTQLTAGKSVNEMFNANKENMYISFHKVEGIDELYLVHCYGQHVLNQTVYPVLRRAVLTCAGIIGVLLSVIFFVWCCQRSNLEYIMKLAYVDPITNGNNLNYFTERATELIGESKKKLFTVIRFDIANFRYINEAYGHLRADKILQIVSTESAQMFTGKEMCVRMNADQYVVLMENDRDFKKQIFELTDRVNVQAMEIGIKFPIKLKCGVYKVRQDDRDVNQLIDRANVARKALVGDEKELFSIYSDHIIKDMRDLDKIEVDMEKALIDGEFKVFLQPKWDIAKDRIYGAEALVRWIKADGTMVFPNDFIPIFEKNGFIEKLDFYMLDKVCMMLHKLAKADLPVFPISVNQSRRLMDNPDYVSSVAHVINKYNIPDHMVELEVTESVFFGETEKMISIITELKKQKVLLSMDDFGTGYSSLNLLKDAPFDVLKIDREFLSESITSKTSVWILQKIIEMATGLGIRVVCEGVETKEQIDLLKRLGCNYVQGYYYSKPISTGEFIQKYFGDYIELSDDNGESLKTE